VSSLLCSISFLEKFVAGGLQAAAASEARHGTWEAALEWRGDASSLWPR